jgi:glycerol-3-phosphate acyltransferase PlsX
VLGVTKPRVALLNIGTEAQKGNEVTRAAYELLQASTLNFAGNVEPREIFAGPVDVVVCDAFVGNVLLKGVEGFLLQLTQGIRRELKSSARTALGGSLAKPALRRALKIMDYTEYGGAPLFGLNGACIKCHGSSNGFAVANGIRVAAQFAARDVLGAMAAALAAQPRMEPIATKG